MPKPKPEMIKTTIRVPKALWDKVRIRAIREGRSAEGIVNSALGEYLRREGGM